jgi:hypothetical protein
MAARRYFVIDGLERARKDVRSKVQLICTGACRFCVNVGPKELCIMRRHPAGAWIRAEYHQCGCNLEEFCLFEQS